MVQLKRNNLADVETIMNSINYNIFIKLHADDKDELDLIAKALTSIKYSDLDAPIGYEEKGSALATTLANYIHLSVMKGDKTYFGEDQGITLPPVNVAEARSRARIELIMMLEAHKNEFKI